nr:hypothetical protein [uncultured Allomuricauda sp.]
MKQLLVIPFIFIMLVKPLWPIAEYIINYNYIVTNLCENREQPQLQCNGKCYLFKLLAEENRQQEDNPFENQQQNNELIQLVYYVPQSDLQPTLVDIEQNITLWSYFDQMNTPPFINKPTPPPKTWV